jgi:hypothetical protein
MVHLDWSRVLRNNLVISLTCTVCDSYLSSSTLGRSCNVLKMQMFSSWFFENNSCRISDRFVSEIMQTKLSCTFAKRLLDLAIDVKKGCKRRWMQLGAEEVRITLVLALCLSDHLFSLSHFQCSKACLLIYTLLIMPFPCINIMSTMPLNAFAGQKWTM